MTDILVVTNSTISSFSILADQLQKFLGHKHNFEIKPFHKINVSTVCDILLPLWWKPLVEGLLDKVRVKKAVVGCVFDAHSWTVTDLMVKNMDRALKTMDYVVVGSDLFLRSLRKQYNKIPPSRVIHMGVDTKLFTPYPFPQEFTGMWVGNSKAAEGDLKGFGIAKLACESAGVKLLIADSSEEQGPAIPFAHMPTWYRDGSFTVIPSKSECGPFPLLETLAMGRPACTTRVGLAPNLILHGINGCLTPRNVESFAKNIRWLRSRLETHYVSISNVARRSVEPYDIRHVIRKWDEILDIAAMGRWWNKQSSSVAIPKQIQSPIIKHKPTIKEANDSKKITAKIKKYKRLHLACGNKHLKGYCNIDVKGNHADVHADVLALNLPQNHYSEIYSSHLLEHVFPEDTIPLLKRWYNALTPNGFVRISVPDLRLILANTVECTAFGKDPNAPLFGDYRKIANPEDRHRQTFTLESLTRLLTLAGFTNIKQWKSTDIPLIHNIKDWASFETISLNVVASKACHVKHPTTSTPVEAPKVKKHLFSDIPLVPIHPRKINPILISVITGTYNRLHSLQRFINSVRRNMKVAEISIGQYEIVLADGGSTDGTIRWINKQRDCKIVKGGLTGAIDAFNAAYKASSGEYVFQANDDVEIVGNSLAIALSYIRAHNEIAQVCFEYSMDRGKAWLAPIHRAGRCLVSGTPHPNVAITRRIALEDVVTLMGDFWGSPEFRIDKTYAGDTAQGAALAKAGWKSLYLVDRVRVVDHHYDTKDKLKRDNIRSYKHEDGAIDDLFEKINAQPVDNWKSGILIPEPGCMPRRSPISAGPQERLMLLTLAHVEEQQLGLRKAFGEIGPTCEAMRLFPEFRSLTPRKKIDKIIQKAKAHKPTLIWIQLQGNDVPGLQLIKSLREVCPKECMICTWNGDVRTYWYPKPEAWLVETGMEADLALHSNLDYPRMLRKHGVKHPGYLQVGYDKGTDDIILGEVKLPVNLTNCAIFTGSTQRHDARTPTIVDAVKACKNLHVFGHRWFEDNPQMHEFLPRNICAAAYKTAALSINMSITADLDGYSSDRLCRLGGAGACIALRKFRGMDHWGIEENKHVLCWSTTNELIGLIRRWTIPEKEQHRNRLRKNVYELAKQWWSWEAVVEMFLALVRYERWRRPEKRLRN